MDAVDIVPMEDSAGTFTVGASNGVEIPAQQNVTYVNFHNADSYITDNWKNVQVKPNFIWPELYDYFKSQSGLLHQNFLGNTTKGCEGSVNMVVNREAENTQGLVCKEKD